MLLKKIVIKNRTLNNSILELSLVSTYFGTNVKLDFKFPEYVMDKTSRIFFNYRLLTSHLRRIYMLQNVIFHCVLLLFSPFYS